MMQMSMPTALAAIVIGAVAGLLIGNWVAPGAPDQTRHPSAAIQAPVR